MVENFKHRICLSTYGYTGYEFEYFDENGNKCTIVFASLPNITYQVVEATEIFDFKKGTALEALQHMTLYELRDFFFNSGNFASLEKTINDIWHNTL
jgi:hypothetical protein